MRAGTAFGRASPLATPRAAPIRRVAGSRLRPFRSPHLPTSRSEPNGIRSFHRSSWGRIPPWTVGHGSVVVGIARASHEMACVSLIVPVAPGSASAVERLPDFQRSLVAAGHTVEVLVVADPANPAVL